MKLLSGRNVIFLCLAVFAVMLLRTAWICDDAYITFRTIDNVLNGYGLTWNTVERVQTFTHPLWMMLLTLVYFFTREAFLTGIVVSLAVTLAAVALFAFRLSRTVQAACIGILILALSKSFTDFSTSGLENPFSHLLIALFFGFFIASESNLRTLKILSFVAALGTLTRIDLTVVFLPALAYMFWQIKSWRAIRAMLIGFAPVIVWELFSFFYYGLFVPNTAYAKLNTGIPRLDMMAQGLYYLKAVSWADPIVGVTIILSLAVAIWKRDRVLLILAGGLILYLLYVVWIGGCFMAGRYLTVPLFLAVIILVRLEFVASRKIWLPALVVFIALGAISPKSPLYSGSSYGKGLANYSLSGFGEDKSGLSLGQGIVDERLFYFQQTGLLTADGFKTELTHPWVNDGLRLRREGPPVVKKGAVGIVGYFAGPQVYVIDIYALCNPLLAHLPALMDINWRIGHFKRVIPAGYEESIISGKNRLANKSLASYYDTLSYIVCGPPFDWRRIISAAKLNLGAYDYLLEKAGPLLLVRPLAGLYRPVMPGTNWHSAENLSLPTAGAVVPIGDLVNAPRVEIGLDGNDDYSISFSSGERQLGGVVIEASYKADSGLAVYRITVPPQVTGEGYDAITVVPSKGDRKYALGYINLMDAHNTFLPPPTPAELK